jgi:hypothetical protein
MSPHGVGLRHRPQHPPAAVPHAADDTAPAILEIDGATLLVDAHGVI